MERDSHFFLAEIKDEKAYKRFLRTVFVMFLRGGWDRQTQRERDGNPNVYFFGY